MGKKLQAPQALQSVGPGVPVLIGCPEVVNKKLAEDGKETTPTIEGLALIDTGCSATSVDKTAIKKLALPAIGTTMLTHASGASETTIHVARILFPTLPGVPKWESRVISCDLSKHPFDVLIGRDILSHMVLVFNGPAGLFTLAW